MLILSFVSFFNDFYTDEEDVFECGRCKEKFTDMTVFMLHKKGKSCQKAKKQNDGNASHSGKEPDIIVQTSQP